MGFPALVKASPDMSLFEPTACGHIRLAHRPIGLSTARLGPFVEDWDGVVSGTSRVFVETVLASAFSAGFPVPR